MTTTRIAIDIGGTFTDVVLDRGGRRTTTKVLTTPGAPEKGVVEGVEAVLAQAGVRPGEVSLIIHGTTLATNALIERKGAPTALVTTDGFRDSVEIAYEHRFEQYDIYMERPAPLVPRERRYGIPERVAADGSVLLPLDEAAVRALVPQLRRDGVRALAIGYLHAYANPAHEQRTRDILAEALPEASISISSEVCPEIREYDRISTTCANAYVQPLMAGYLARLDAEMRGRGLGCPLLLMMSSGGVTTLDTAMRYPIRLVESGPAGGAILARHIAAEIGAAQVVSFDMGGTTAKICLIDDFQPQLSRSFEVARMYRFLRGSGLPLRIPVIDMVEIGAGGGSIASVDELKRINVGPESAGADPGPACYGRGGTRPSVTDADLVLGRIDPARFAGGKVALYPERAAAAVEAAVGAPLGAAVDVAAAGIGEIVDENMANAARVHAIEVGKETAGRTLVAFGGAAPLHAARLAEKLDVARVVVPTGAGVGSAIGFLKAPIAYEVIRTRYMNMRNFDPEAVNELFAGMRAEAEAVVRLGAPDAPLAEVRRAYMRYRGQGHEIAVPLPERRFAAGDREFFDELFAERYRGLYGRVIPQLTVEVMSWSLALSTDAGLPVPAAPPAAVASPPPVGRRPIFDTETGRWVETDVYWRPDLVPGARLSGPAVIAEDETSTFVSARFDAAIDALGYIVMTRKA